METKSDCVSEISLLVLGKRRRLPLLRKRQTRSHRLVSVLRKQSVKERGGGRSQGFQLVGGCRLKSGPVGGLRSMSQSDGLSSLLSRRERVTRRRCTPGHDREPSAERETMKGNVTGRSAVATHCSYFRERGAKRM